VARTSTSTSWTDGLCHLSAAFCPTDLRTRDSVRMRSRVSECLRMRQPVRRPALTVGEVSDTADQLLAHLSLLYSSKPHAASDLILRDNGHQWRNAYASQRVCGLFRSILGAYRPGDHIKNEQELGENLFNGHDLSEDKAADVE